MANTQINLNDYVSFKMTDFGKEVLKEKLAAEAKELNLPTSRNIESFKQETGEYMMQFHEFAYYFGSQLYIGNKNLIEDNTLKVINY